ncbi:MAG: Signal transduction histidine kinase, partial [Verrucomicrobiales bacterium]|nr:Signal transduction histidine kinase [Verrucomicrobiales bacterium]
DQVYRTIVDNMNEGAVSIDRSQTIVYCNTRFAEMMQMPLENIGGIPFSSLAPAHARLSLVEFFKRSFKKRGTCETTLVTLGGVDMPVQLSANPVAMNTELGVSVVVTDVTQQKELQKTQREMSVRIVTAQEEERYRVSRELHDGINQLLSSARHRFFSIEKNLAKRKVDLAMVELARTRELLDHTIDEVRRISRNLRPSELDDLGLVPALQALVEEFQNRTRVKVVMRSELSRWPIERFVELAVYRIVQEGFNNIERHARAKRVSLSLSREAGAMRVVIGDDGRGFNARPSAHRGFGLANMKERAMQAGGTVECNSSRKKGTTIRLSIPL